MSQEVRQRYTNVCAQLGEITYKIHREERVLQAALDEQRKRAELRDKLLETLRDIEVEFITVTKQEDDAAKKAAEKTKDGMGNGQAK